MRRLISASALFLALGSSLPAAGTLNPSAEWTSVGEAAGDYFGVSVATAGDVDGGGSSEVIVGARGKGTTVTVRIPIERT